MALKPSLREVLSRLVAEGALPPGADERALPALKAWWRRHGATPWYVRLLVGAGAWVAALFMGLFFGLLLDMLGLESEGALIVLGLLVTGAAVGLRRMSVQDFLVQLSLAVGLAGQGLFVGGVAAAVGQAEGGAVALLLLSLVLLFLHPDRIQRFLSTGGAALAALFLLYKLGGWTAVDVGLVALAAGAHVLVLHPARAVGRQELVDTVGVGLVCTLLGMLLARSLLGTFQPYGSPQVLPPSALLTLGLAAVTLYTASRVLRDNGLRYEGLAGLAVFAALLLTALLTLRTPGVIAAVGLLALGFHRRAVVLLGLAGVFLLGFGWLYYYDLTLSLLAKSLALLGSGLVLLGLRLLLLRAQPAAPAAAGEVH